MTGKCDPVGLKPSPRPLPSSLRLLGELLRPFADVLYPPLCFVCERRLESRSNRVCDACWSTIRVLTREDRLFTEMYGRLTKATGLSDLVSLYRFEKQGTLQSILHLLKYEEMTTLGTELGRRLGARILEEVDVEAIDAIIPVPLHAVKRRERGYNQSDFIAQGVRDATRIPLAVGVLRRHRSTASQTALTVAEREENVRDAFSVATSPPALAEGKRFLLVDDVITTGATVEACAQALVKAGARSLVACSVALAQHSV